MFQKLASKIHNRKGFTLIELIVVIAIIVVLIALIAPSATQLIGSATTTRARADAKTIYTASQAYLTELQVNGTTAPDAIALTDIEDYITTDVSATIDSVTIVNDGYVVTSVAVTEGDATGNYPNE